MFTFTHWTVVAALVAVVVGQVCGPGASCPELNPCCSEYGFCGQGTAYCRGGCDPLWSNSLTSCEPDPICQSETFDFTNSAVTAPLILMNSTNFNNDASQYAWTLDSGSINWSSEGVELVLTESNDGSRLSTTRYINYGTITTTMKTGRWAGVVTAFITMSDAKDEIDWEFPGATTTEGQTNWYWLGVANYSATNGQTTSGLTDTYENFHNFTIDWQPDALTWQVDGVIERTLYKNSTLTTDEYGTRYEYPSTPSRVQISLWPAGLASSAPGTVQWGGGMINWNDPDYVANNNSFVAVIQSVSITCSPQVATVAGAQSYIYTGNDTTGIPQVTQSTTTFVVQPQTSSSSSGNSSGSGTAPGTGSGTGSSTGSGTGTSGASSLMHPAAIALVGSGLAGLLAALMAL